MCSEILAQHQKSAHLRLHSPVFYPRDGLVKTIHVPNLVGPCHSDPVHLSPLPLTTLCPAQELDDIYQDAASNVLLALCRHSWPAVAKHLETELLKGVFPHRSLLYVMGILSSQGMCCHRMDRGPGNGRRLRRASGTTPPWPWLHMGHAGCSSKPLQCNQPSQQP